MIPLNEQIVDLKIHAWYHLAQQRVRRFPSTVEVDDGTHHDGTQR